MGRILLWPWYGCVFCVGVYHAVDLVRTLIARGEWWGAVAVIACLGLYVWLLYDRKARERFQDMLFAPPDRVFDRWNRPSPAMLEFERLSNQLEEELENLINPLPVEEAKRRAEVLLADRTRFECQEAPPQPSEAVRLQELAPQVRSVFEGYSRVHLLPGGFNLERRAIEPSLMGHDLIVIGFSGREHEHLAVRPGEEAVFYVVEDGGENDEQPWIHAFSSVYHCVLYFDREWELLFSQSESRQRPPTEVSPSAGPEGRGDETTPA